MAQEGLHGVAPGVACGKTKRRPYIRILQFEVSSCLVSFTCTRLALSSSDAQCRIAMMITNSVDVRPMSEDNFQKYNVPMFGGRSECRVAVTISKVNLHRQPTSCSPQPHDPRRRQPRSEATLRLCRVHPCPPPSLAKRVDTTPPNLDSAAVWSRVLPIAVYWFGSAPAISRSPVLHTR